MKPFYLRRASRTHMCAILRDHWRHTALHEAIRRHRAAHGAPMPSAWYRHDPRACRVPADAG